MVRENGTTNATITVDKARRIVLPKPVRDELQLQAGDSLEFEISDQEITLRPVRAKARMQRVDGMWVVTDGEPTPENMVEDTIEDVRRERDQQILGKMERNDSSIVRSSSPLLLRNTYTTPRVKRPISRVAAKIAAAERIAWPNFIPHLPVHRGSSAGAAMKYYS
jgi:AbrB family looped-hinge helix DNA binding protein